MMQSAAAAGAQLPKQHAEHFRSDGTHVNSAPAASSLDAAAALFPRVPISVRPPPRRPIDLDIPVPLLSQLPIAGPATTSAAALIPPTYAPVHMLSPIISHQPISSSSEPYQFSPPRQFPAAAEPVPLASDVNALEEQLTRLLEWKSEVKQRRNQLLQLEEQRKSVPFFSLQEQLRLDEQLTAMRAAVLMDTEHRPYWAEQCTLVQARLQMLLTDEQEHNSVSSPLRI